MKNNKLITEKINEGIEYLQEQDKKLSPVLEYLTEFMCNKKEELNIHDAFDFYIKLQEQKVNSLLLLTKMKEILDYEE